MLSEGPPRCGGGLQPAARCSDRLLQVLLGFLHMHAPSWFSSGLADLTPVNALQLKNGRLAGPLGN